MDESGQAQFWVYNGENAESLCGHFEMLILYVSTNPQLIECAHASPVGHWLDERGHSRFMPSIVWIGLIG